MPRTASHRHGPTLRELARSANVSPTTASLALNDHPRVAVATRRRIAEVAAQMGFSNNVSYAARRMARARFHSRSASFDQVGFIYLADPDVDLDLVSVQMMRGAEHELSRHHACLVFVRAAHRDDWQKVRRLAETGIVDGWLIVGPVTDSLLKRLRSLRLPVVILGEHRCTQSVHSVNVDSVGVGRLAAQYLAGLGHRRIAFISGVPLKFKYQRDALQGFRAAARELGLDQDERLFCNDPFARSLDPRSARQWLEQLGEPPTAIFCTEPTKTEFILRPLREAEVDIPRRMSLLTCEIPSWRAATADLLTHIELPMGEVGRQSAMLLHKVVTEASVASCEINLAPSLVEGWSTCTPP